MLLDAANLGCSTDIAARRTSMSRPGQEREGSKTCAGAEGREPDENDSKGAVPAFGHP